MRLFLILIAALIAVFLLVNNGSQSTSEHQGFSANKETTPYVPSSPFRFSFQCSDEEFVPPSPWKKNHNGWGIIILRAPLDILPGEELTDAPRGRDGLIHNEIFIYPSVLRLQVMDNIEKGIENQLFLPLELGDIDMVGELPKNYTAYHRGSQPEEFYLQRDDRLIAARCSGAKYANGSPIPNPSCRVVYFLLGMDAGYSAQFPYRALHRIEEIGELTAVLAQKALDTCVEEAEDS